MRVLVSPAYAAIFLSTSAIRGTYAAYFNIANTFQGSDFFTWKWWTLDDPTHGHVNYIDRDTAVQANLSYASDDNTKFYMHADSEEIVSMGARGRDSIRIESTTSYDESVLILDVQHMPEGCTTWPAFWTLSKDGPWPNGGEIDIIEGVNLNDQNLVSLHTMPGCEMVDPRQHLGHTISLNCDSAVNYNQGCGVAFNQPNSFGVPFNANGGGWFAMSKTREDGIKVWFWPRASQTVPKEVKEVEGHETISTDQWPKPDTHFPPNSCKHDDHFDAHVMVFDLTFCGDWAGTAYAQSGCGISTCEDFVDNNPDAFRNAYWEINSLRAYNLIEEDELYAPQGTDKQAPLSGPDNH
ncbi:glycoside hydrolase family 16 protein [Cylindrobasidium torrendii FP15055 ss-10]|uniref:Glycoside hydrolase family 16 protein n=1 Tax=Cylindrobasidium torrendii FP15055 ss-10 TaxID=1314674 RepID=A0A0D7BW15_9AGAR|nr:glycoside hydrolase family 16 protein [Cylindrobasidium torrendii FP15055 ss-10]